jgi:hypothetical protein
MKPLKLFASNWWLLLTTSSTLICCVIPSVLVVLGLGSSLVSFLKLFPQFIILSENKNILFIFVFLLLTTSAWIFYKKRNICPINLELAMLCKKQKKVNFYLLLLSWFIFIFSFIFVYF